MRHFIATITFALIAGSSPGWAAQPDHADESMNPNIGTDTPLEKLQQKPDTTDSNPPPNANSNNRTHAQKLRQKPDDPVPSQPVDTSPNSRH